MLLVTSKYVYFRTPLYTYAPRLWNELPDNIKAADSVQNFKKQLKTLLFRKEFNWLYGPWQLSNDPKALLNIIGGKGALSNINYI